MAVVAVTLSAIAPASSVAQQRGIHTYSRERGLGFIAQTDRGQREGQRENGAEGGATMTDD